jgi:hypothetical protein
MVGSMPVDAIRPMAGIVEPADLVIRNAAVHTGDQRLPSASAVAIRDGWSSRGVEFVGRGPGQQQVAD